ncbi:MAG: GatB/YqeY domain-containing protein [Pseudomonadota bacterium]
MSEIRAAIDAATKAAMKARDKERLAALRLINAEIKQFEVDKRETPDDDTIITLLTRMQKQRRDSIAAYSDAGRDDLVATEEFELGIVQEFLPAQLDAAEIEAAIAAAIEATGASSMKDMGAVMGRLSGELAGRADMGAVSAQVRAKLG